MQPAWEKRNACRYLVGKSEGKRPLGRPTRKLEDNIKMEFREIVWGGKNWIQLDHDKWSALVNKVMNLRVPYYW
jgi:hypothetical protein